MTVITGQVAADRVARGAAFLDAHDPDFWKEGVPNAIDLAALDLANPAMCVLGQRCPLEVLFAFLHGREPMAPLDRLRDFSDEQVDDSFVAFAESVAGVEPSAVIAWGSDLGFAASTTWEYRDLTAEWRRVITERRAAA